MKKFLTVLMVTTAIGLTACGHQEAAQRQAEQNNPLLKADSDMKKVMDAQASLLPKPIEGLTPVQARTQPTPTDGVKKVIVSKGDNPNDPMGVKTKDITYTAAKGTQPARLYMPADVDGKEKLPVVVYYHGGGWVIGDLNVYDGGPRAIAKMAKAIVVSVEYRKGPENRFPAAHDDAFAAYKWVLRNIGKYGGDAKNVAVMGESAGGNLAINTAIKARDNRIQLPVHQVLVYPVAGVDMNTPSYQENAKAKPLNKAMMAWFMKHVIRSDADKADPRLDLIGKANLSGLPSTTVIAAEIDPLLSDSEMLVSKLQKSGVDVKFQEFEGVTHEFFGMGAVVDDAKNAEKLAADDLKEAFGKRN